MQIWPQINDQFEWQNPAYRLSGKLLILSTHSKLEKSQMFTIWFLNDSNLYQKINLYVFQQNKSFSLKNTLKLGYWRTSWKPILSHVFPKEGDMVFRKLNHGISCDFFWDASDLKKHVFIYLRKQIRQKMEGFSAS